ncbi:ATP-binding protein [Lentzea sp. BCCO 10_0856]|uniref:ATP-binding protein n=1 Tax=Lentzea miocenica TaxID=3095431 RepID=A0ABU4T6X0_9PSEU|nr:ATP-binding protein [Lentzea sp. BCCO 10_0856]MDX8033702.1 ATP-binding protein [Lentzea sp. BCCO 10_0856]
MVWMLRSFRLENHRSFRDEHELLLMPAYARGRETLPVVAIYGANASGKSNLLDGLKFMAEAVRDSFAVWGPDAGVVGRRPFKLDAGKRADPSTYVVELIQDGVRYTYGVEVDDVRVREEWLYSYPEKRKRVLFERVGDGIKFGSTLDESKSALEVLETMLRPNALLVSLAAQLKVFWVLPVYRWFVNSLRFRVNADGRVFGNEIAEFLLERPEFKNELVDLVRAADVGIDDVVVAEEGFLEQALTSLVFQNAGAGKTRSALIDASMYRYLAELASEGSASSLKRHVFHGGALPRRPTVHLIHGGCAEPFRLDEESAGTRSWLSVLPTVLSVLRDGGCLVIDEIDASLHPLLTMRLISLFNDDRANAAGGQLIFTTHDATLLNAPFAEEVLARDEVWFVEKERSSGASSLYPLTDFKPRNEDNLERRYLAGRYGAVPELFEDRFTEVVRGDRGEA